MKDDAVIKDNEAVYLLNEQTYLHLRENLQGVGYEVFDKNSPLPEDITFLEAEQFASRVDYGGYTVPLAFLGRHAGVGAGALPQRGGHLR